MGLFDRIKRAFTGEDEVIKHEETKESIVIEKYDKGMEKTRRSFSDRLNEFLADFREIDEDFFEDLEETFISSDVGFEMTLAITDALRDEVRLQNATTSGQVKEVIIEKMVDIYEKGEDNLSALKKAEGRPTVLMFVGVNGVGKTTTIGKLAKKFQDEGKYVMLAAGDTFRAAAVEPLQVWGERNHIPVIAQSSGSDSASVIFDAMQSASARNIDVLIADTAGRLQNKNHLMDELKKIVRVMKKYDETAPHEIMLTLDAGTGQNAISQAKLFNEAVGLTGITLTKLDGTAKGGVIFAIADQFNIPIRFIGVGEKIDDLRPFNSEEFIEALFSHEEEK